MLRCNLRKFFLSHLALRLPLRTKWCFGFCHRQCFALCVRCLCRPYRPCRAHRNTCIRICVCACVCMYTYLQVWAPSLLVCVYIFTYMHTEFASVGIFFHVYKLSLHVLVYKSTYIHIETTCAWVYIYIYVHQVYRCVYTEFTCMCAYIYIHVRQIHMRVYIFTSIHISMKRHRVSCKYRHTCLCSYLVYGCVLCVCRCIHVYMYTRKTPWVHTDTLHWVRIGIHTYVSVFVCVCVFIHMYTCIYDKTSCVIRSYMCVCIYLHIHMWVYTCFNLCMCVYIYLHICAPSLHVYVYIFTYMVAESTCVRVYDYMYAHRV